MLHKSKRESANETIASVLVFWSKAWLPYQQVIRCCIKVEKLYDKYRKVKNRYRDGAAQKNLEDDFRSSLDDLFDIAHKNALTDTKVLVEDKAFLLAQREKGRRGYMAEEDSEFARQEARRTARKLSALRYQTRENKKNNLKKSNPRKKRRPSQTQTAQTKLKILTQKMTPTNLQQREEIQVARRNK